MSTLEKHLPQTTNNTMSELESYYKETMANISRLAEANESFTEAMFFEDRMKILIEDGHSTEYEEDDNDKKKSAKKDEIYGGYNGFFDYGPLGAELKKNIKDAWCRIAYETSIGRRFLVPDHRIPGYCRYWCGFRKLAIDTFQYSLGVPVLDYCSCPIPCGILANLGPRGE